MIDINPVLPVFPTVVQVFFKDFVVLWTSRRGNSHRVIQACLYAVVIRDVPPPCESIVLPIAVAVCPEHPIVFVRRSPMTIVSGVTRFDNPLAINPLLGQ